VVYDKNTRAILMAILYNTQRTHEKHV